MFTALQADKCKGHSFQNLLSSATSFHFLSLRFSSTTLMLFSTAWVVSAQKNVYETQYMYWLCTTALKKNNRNRNQKKLLSSLQFVAPNRPLPREAQVIARRDWPMLFYDHGFALARELDSSNSTGPPAGWERGEDGDVLAVPSRRMRLALDTTAQHAHSQRAKVRTRVFAPAVAQAAVSDSLAEGHNQLPKGMATTALCAPDSCRRWLSPGTWTNVPVKSAGRPGGRRTGGGRPGSGSGTQGPPP